MFFFSLVIGPIPKNGRSVRTLRKPTSVPETRRSRPNVQAEASLKVVAEIIVQSRFSGIKLRRLAIIVVPLERRSGHPADVIERSDDGAEVARDSSPAVRPAKRQP